MGLGATRATGLWQHQKGSDNTPGTSTVWPKCWNSCLCGFIFIRDGCRASAATNRHRMATCSICFKISQQHWTEICPDWIGGSGINLGLREVCRVPHREKFPHWDWSQAFGSSARLKELGSTPTTHTASSHATDVILLHHITCGRQRHRNCRCTIQGSCQQHKWGASWKWNQSVHGLSHSKPASYRRETQGNTDTPRQWHHSQQLKRYCVGGWPDTFSIERVFQPYSICHSQVSSQFKMASYFMVAG